MQFVFFFLDVLVGVGILWYVWQLYMLVYGEVVCVVIISGFMQYVYMGGKGCVKVWDVGQFGVKMFVVQFDCLN